MATKRRKPPLEIPIHIGNRTFIAKEIRDGSMCDDLGEVLFTLGKINIAPNQTEDCLADTLLHEVIHAVDFIFGATGTYLTEEQVVRLTGGLLAVFHDPRNKAFMEYILLALQERKRRIE